MDKIPFILEQLYIDNFTINEDILDPSEKARVDTVFDFSVDFKNHFVRCISNIKYIQEGKEVLSLTLISVFRIENNSFNSMIKEDKLTIPVFFLRYMATFSTGVARGVILSKTEGTKLQTMYLPQINLIKVIDADATFSNNKQ